MSFFVGFCGGDSFMLRQRESEHLSIYCIFNTHEFQCDVT